LELTTEEYISFFLSINQNSWIIAPFEVRLTLILNSKKIDNDKITEHIKTLSYKDFLNTDYWNIISKHIRHEYNYKCQICKAPGYVIHHKDYNRHGQEHIYWKEDLLLVCPDCHKNLHSQSNKSKEYSGGLNGNSRTAVINHLAVVKG